jgi:hypothetical protein
VLKGDLGLFKVGFALGEIFEIFKNISGIKCGRASREVNLLHIK